MVLVTAMYVKKRSKKTSKMMKRNLFGKPLRDFKRLQIADYSSTPKKKNKIIQFFEKYKVQVYVALAFVSAASISFLIGYAMRSYQQKKSLKFADISSPHLASSTAQVTSFNFRDVKLPDGKSNAYRYDTDIILGKVNSAAFKLGIKNPIKENRYNRYYFWKDEKQELYYSYITGKIFYKGSSNIFWSSEDEIKKGIAEIFSINTANLKLIFYSPGEKRNWWTFEFQYDKKVVFCEGSNTALSVFTDSNNMVVELTFCPVDTIGSIGLPLLKGDYVKQNIGVLPKYVNAFIYSDEECKSELCYIDPIQNPKGTFDVHSAEIAYYKERIDRPFLIPVLYLKGEMITVDGLKGEATALVDIVDWAEYSRR